MRERKVPERVLERARDLPRVRAARRNEVLRDVPERLPRIRLAPLGVPVRRLGLGVGDERGVEVGGGDIERGSVCGVPVGEVLGVNDVMA